MTKHHGFCVVCCPMNPMTARLNSTGLSNDMAWEAFVIVTALLPAMHVLTAAVVA